jgi:S-adenosylmethionine/arginine decarboxylase-like enzyme
MSLPPAFEHHASWRGVRSQEQVEQDRRTDSEIVAQFERIQPWGMETLLDLSPCNPQRIRDPAYLRSFIINLCAQIHMRRHGEPLIERFGAEERVSGWTIIQLIETSNLNVHFIDESNAGCLNVFSCSSYPPLLTAALCQKWFEAATVRLTVVFRGPEGPSGG